ncbi:hypothetical protein Tco_1260814, partial [Tanacetum coccineum]
MTLVVPLINFKLEDVFMGQVFSKNAKSGSALSEYYHRSIILTTDPIPNVKGTFATLSRDGSHRSTQSHNVSKTGNGNSAFVVRTNPKNSNGNWSNSNNHPRKLNRPNLVCTHYNMNGHTAHRCFELVGYPPNFKKNIGTNKGSISNNAISGIKDQSSGSSNSFTDDKYKRLMALISEKSGSSSMPANIAEEELSSEPNDDGRDSRSGIGKGTYQLSHVGTENTCDALRHDMGHPDDC